MIKYSFIDLKLKEEDERVKNKVYVNMVLVELL